MFAQLNPSRRILMGPGPSDIHPRVLSSMALPVIGHLDPEFVQIMNEVKGMVQETFKTTNHMSYVISGPGTTGMEGSLANLLEPGDKVLICVNGVFGERMVDMGNRIGAEVIRVAVPWGEPMNIDKVRVAAAELHPKVIAVVHAETSTGVCQPVREIAAVAKEHDSLLLVDAVTSYCGTDVRMDEWGIDVIYSGSQKCLRGPPGLSQTSFSDRALEVIRNRKSPVQSWFLDVSLISSYWEGQNRAYHHTAPVSAVYGIREAYRLVLEEGLENRFQRHRNMAEHLWSSIEELGIEILVEPEYRLPMLTVARIPEGVDDRQVRSTLLNEYNIEIGGGLGKFAGKVWRIGLMGESCNLNYINALTGALKEILDR